MLSREENELLTRIGPGTPMGELLRRYWIPSGLSQELPGPDCPPIRVKLLGERLVAFRDTHGRVGLVDEFCAHRRASLFLGRNEEGGLRCVYHGWKYNLEGNCVDMPTEPPESNFRHKIQLRAYPTVELGGVIWAYLGPKDKQPAPPRFAWTQVPEGHRYVTKVWQECNWLQPLDGGLDTVHPSFLHRNLMLNTTRAGINPTNNIYMWSPTVPKLPKMEVELTDYGFIYATFVPLGEGGNYVLISHYVLPFHRMRATTARGDVKNSMIEGHIAVPMDDENTMDYIFRYSFGDDPVKEMEVVEEQRGRASGEITEGFRKVRNKENNWLIDRSVQKTESYTGIEGINTQDHAVQESMGPISDRTQEHLGSTDKILIAMRRQLIQAARTVQEGGNPPGVMPSYYGIRPKAEILSSRGQWRDALKGEIYASRRGQDEP